MVIFQPAMLVYQRVITLPKFTLQVTITYHTEREVRKIIDSEVPFLVGDMGQFPGGANSSSHEKLPLPNRKGRRVFPVPALFRGKLAVKLRGGVAVSKGPTRGWKKYNLIHLAFPLEDHPT